MWKTIENSYFWLTYSFKSKQVVLRFLNPLSTRVRVFRVSFDSQVINLVGEDSFSEKIMLLRKRKQHLLKELALPHIKDKQRLQNELSEVESKLQKVIHASNIH